MNEVYMREIGRGTTASRPEMTASRPEMTALRPEEMEICNADD
jgi:hypothetical protein